MNSIQIALAVIAGICFYVGIYHALVGLRRRPVDGLHLIFAMMSLAYGVLAFGAVLLHPAVAVRSVEDFLIADRWSLMGQLVGTLLLLWFIAFYTKVKPYPVLLILSAPLVMLMWVHLTSPFTFLYTDITGFFEVTLPWGEPITIADIALNSWANQLLQAVILAYIVFITYAGVRQYRRGERQEALLLGLATAILLAANVNDILLDLDLITSIYLLPFGYVAMIVVMSLTLSNEIIETEEQLETLNLELEQRVDDRTAELSAANSALQKAKKAAEAANRAKSVFLANMSHELRTPLNTVLGFTQIMERDTTLPAQHRENLAIISRSGRHLLDLINDVLEMSKVEAGQSTLTETSFDLHYDLDSLHKMMRLRAEKQGLRFNFERAADVPRYIRTDERKLRQVLINLLSNAIKFTEEGSASLRVGVLPSSGEVTASRTYPQGGEDTEGELLIHLQFEVADTGAGIAPAEMEKLFEPFSQTASGLQAQRGTGLGLPISRQFVQLMGGDITVHSIPALPQATEGKTQGAHGTTFTFVIPVTVTGVADVPAAQPVRRVIGLVADQPSYRILVVDDSADNRSLLRQWLEQVGFAVREAADGQEAIALHESWKPHLIWMDMRMPVLDGYEATRQIKATTAGQAPVIIAVTASAFEEERAVVLSAGCDDFVRKPFVEAEIFDMMARHLAVRYVYEVIEQADALDDKPSPGQVSLTPADLAELPAKWIVDLRQAAMRGYLGPVLDLIGQLGPAHNQVAQALSALARDFQFGKIVALTET
jgi:signal transduction histidine kinase/CheY-like chemotaxis protein